MRYICVLTFAILLLLGDGNGPVEAKPANETQLKKLRQTVEKTHGILAKMVKEDEDELAGMNEGDSDKNPVVDSYYRKYAFRSEKYMHKDAFLAWNGERRSWKLEFLRENLAIAEQSLNAFGKEKGKEHKLRAVNLTYDQAGYAINEYLDFQYFLKELDEAEDELIHFWLLHKLAAQAAALKQDEIFWVRDKYLFVRYSETGELTKVGKYSVTLEEALKSEMSNLEVREAYLEYVLNQKIESFKELLGHENLFPIASQPKRALIVVGDIWLEGRQWKVTDKEHSLRWQESQMMEAVFEARRDLEKRGYRVSIEILNNRIMPPKGSEIEDPLMIQLRRVVDKIKNPDMRAFVLFGHGSDYDSTATDDKETIVWSYDEAYQMYLDPFNVRQLRKGLPETEILIIHACKQGLKNNKAHWRNAFKVAEKGVFHSWDKGITGSDVLKWQKEWE